MNAIALASRLARDFPAKSIVDMDADVRLEIVDAINGGLQKMHVLAPSVSKRTTGSIFISPPVTVALGVTNGGTEVTGYVFTPDQFYRTIRISGDSIDNQITGELSLLHPYGGETGTVSATFYADGVAIIEPYEEIVGDPLILETDIRLVHFKRSRVFQCKEIGDPDCYHVEANAPNQNSPSPSVIRFNKLPDRLLRLQAEFSLAPARINFPDILTPGAIIPLREELVESYLLPIARDILSSSSHWKSDDAKSKVSRDAESAMLKYESLSTQYLATPSGSVGTKPGW